jgi:hypothetical protein
MPSRHTLFRVYIAGVTTDAEIVHAVSDLTVTGRGATVDVLANRFGLEPIEMTERLMRLETQGSLLSVALSGHALGMGEVQWVRPGEAALYFSRERYDELEDRVRALAAWKGYELVASDPSTPPRHRRYTIQSSITGDRNSVHGNRLERALWKLRHLPPASGGEQAPPTESGVAATPDP